MNAMATSYLAPTYAHEYSTAILNRNRVPMPPVTFEPNWSDRPRPAKHYPGTLSIQLPDAPPPPQATVATGMHPAPAGDGPIAEAFTLPRLGGMLRDSYGPLGRRLGIQANTDVHGFPLYPRAAWSRGTASGGSLYPCSIYWIAGPGAGVCPGVYHYAGAQHAMQRLLAGDVTGRIRDALDEPTDATQFLLIGVKYWQNAFKYNSFSYHAVSMDVGTLLQTWRLWAGGQGLSIEPRFWFNQTAIEGLLGLAPDSEGLFAVVPLTWAAAVPVTTTPAADMAARKIAVRRQDQERSRIVLTFDAVQQMHRATADAAPLRPAPGTLAAGAVVPGAGAGERTALPPPSPLTMPIRTALTRRRSSFGRFDSSIPMAAADLAALLGAASAARLPTDIDGAADGDLLKFYVFANHMRDVAAGSYEYEPAGHQLRSIHPGSSGQFLQRNYYLTNYSLEQAAAVIVPVMRVTALLSAAGPRGYNVVNAMIGAVAQNFYTAAAALDVGCGVALGFDNVSYVEELELEGTDEAPLLIMMAGHERQLPADYRYELPRSTR